MSSPRDRLMAAIEAWLADDARERIVRARGGDADPPRVVAERHAALRGPRTRELLEEARERGLLEGDELRASVAVLRSAFAAVGSVRAAERVREVLAQRVPHDSDHHPPLVLLERMLTEAHEGRRRLIARSISEVLAPALLGALREGLADVEESLEEAAWLLEIAPIEDAAPMEQPAPHENAPLENAPLENAPLDNTARADTRANARAAPSAQDAARALLADTADAWVELRERMAREARVEIETWADLLFSLRAPRFDPLFDPRRRWRGAAESLSALGVADALNKRARVEHASASSAPRPRSTLIALQVPHDVRIITPSLELGLASERDARIVMGRALALAWTHGALRALVARTEHNSVGYALGGLFAHLLTAPSAQARELSTADARAVRERAVFLELFELRTDAAVVLARDHVASSAYAEAAQHAAREAWQVDVPASIAACACLLERDAAHRSRAARWVAPLFVALREQYDEDWWRNPRAAEPIRAACERGGALSVESWAAELGATAGTRAGRYAELLR